MRSKSVRWLPSVSIMRYLPICLVALSIVYYTGYLDRDCDGAMNGSDSFVQGHYRLVHTFPNGNVGESIVWQQDPGQWLFITPRPDHVYTLITPYAVQRIDTSTPDGTELYIPVFCGRRWALPIVGGQ